MIPRDPRTDNTDRVRTIARDEIAPLERIVKRFRFWILVAGALVSGGFALAEWMHTLASRQDVDVLRTQVTAIEAKIDLISAAVGARKADK